MPQLNLPKGLNRPAKGKTFEGGSPVSLLDLVISLNERS